MKKGLAAALALLCCFAFAAALGESAPADPVLLVELPETAQIIEDVAFEDGDFIQTYQIDGGATVQLLRYASFDMTLEELAESERTGHGEIETLPLTQTGGYPAQGIRFAWTQEDAAVDVTMVQVSVGEQTLLLQAVFPQEMGRDAIDALLKPMLDSMDVLDTQAAPEDEAEVG